MTGAAAASTYGGGGAPGLAVTVAPTSVNGTYRGSSGTAQNVQTGNVTATPTGGVAPYTYGWIKSDASGNIWTISAATSATTSFTCLAMAAGTDDSTTFRVTVTDSLGSTAQKIVPATAFNASTIA